MKRFSWDRVPPEGRPYRPPSQRPPRLRALHRARFVGVAVASMAAGLGLGPVVAQLATTSEASAQSYNCAASTSGYTQLAESSFTASSNVSGASGVQTPITQAVSGVDSSRFTSATDEASGMTYEVNIGSAQTTGEIEMYSPDYATDYAVAYNVNVSSNGTSWTTVASCTNSVTPEIVSFGAVADQYIEAVLTAGSTKYWWSIEQFRIYNAGTGATTTTAATTTTTAGTSTTTKAMTTTTAASTTTTAPAGYSCAASTSGYTQLAESSFTASTTISSATGVQVPITQAVSRVDSSRFTSGAAQAAGMNYAVNMGSAQTVGEIQMYAPDYSADSAAGYSVEVSSNGTNWTNVATGCTGTASPETVSFPAVADQYLQVVLSTAKSTNWWSIEQFRIYRSSSGTTTTTPATTTTTTPPPSPALPTAGPFSGPGNGLCLDAAGGSPGAGNEIDAYTCNGSASQIFQEATNGTLQVLSNCVDVTGTTSGSNVELNPCSGASTQNWAVESNGEIVNNASGLCLDDPGNNTGAGAVQMEVETCTGSAQQDWTAPLAPSTTADQTSFGPNSYVFTTSMSTSSIQDTIDAIFAAQQTNQFGTERYAIMFEPGTYPIFANIGYYTSIMGLGQNPTAVNITGNVTVDAQWNGGNATENFWRSASNMEVTPSGGTEVWAVAQAGPFRRMDVQGTLQVAPTAEGYSSGGFISDSIVTGSVISGSEQQWMTRNSTIGSWSGDVWNMVFSGVKGAPAQSFPSPPYTTLATSRATREEPYIYLNSSGVYNVFVPAAESNSSGTTWTATSNTAGTSLPLSEFYVATPSDTAAQMNAALAAGEDLLFTPGIYDLNQALQVNNANTIVMGIGLPTLIPQGGVNTVDVADVEGVNVSGILFDAGTTTSAALLDVGVAGSTENYSSDPVTIDDDFFRIGGDIAGSVTTALIDNSNYSIIDDIWAWRADHGNAGTVGWTVNTADNGLIVNGNNVTGYGLFVEHFQQTEVEWYGNAGEDVFFQNENPYDPPSQAAWMDGSQDGYPAFEVEPGVTTFSGYGMGSYSYFNQGVAIENAEAFEAPATSGVVFNDILTVFLNGSGGIESVINGTGAAVNSTNGKTDVTTYS
jgi:hypothetical protein